MNLLEVGIRDFRELAAIERVNPGLDLDAQRLELEPVLAQAVLLQGANAMEAVNSALLNRPR